MIAHAQCDASDLDINKKYVGTVVPPDTDSGPLAADGLKLMGGVAPWETDEDIAITYVKYRGAATAWLLRRLAPPPGAGPDECCWNAVLDVLVPPKLESGEEFFASDCTVHGRLEPRLVAITRAIPNKPELSVRKVWTVDKKTLQFESVSTKGVACTPTIDD